MKNKQIIETFSRRLWDDKDLTAIDEFMVDDAVIHSPLNTTTGTITMKEVVQKWLTAFPDLMVKSHDIIAEDNKVVWCWEASGTHLGSFFDTSPSHQEVQYSGVTIYTLNNQGKIIEYWALVDMHAIMRQLMKYESMSEVLDG